MTKPKVCLIYTGGTIGMIRENDVLKPPEDPSRFTDIAPEINELADIDYFFPINKDSTNVTPADWTKMANEVHSRMGPDNGYVGFVIAHGTDTMHFSASALAFAFGPDLNVPVVFTGAQTDASILHGDARINLIRSVKVAIDPEPIAEVVICFGDFVFRGCRAQKKDERRFAAFESPAFFPLADITERLLINPVADRRREHPAPMQFMPDFESEVLQISLIPGVRPRILMPLLEARAVDGIILQSFGAGNVPDFEEYSFQDFIEHAVRMDIPVIITSQFPANSTLDTAYEPGVRAIESGAIPTGNMTNAAATAKFRWVIARVRTEVEAGLARADQRLARIKYYMTRPYVDEMDDAGNAQRNAI